MDPYGILGHAMNLTGDQDISYHFRNVRVNDPSVKDILIDDAKILGKTATAHILQREELYGLFQILIYILIGVLVLYKISEHKGLLLIAYRISVTEVPYDALRKEL